MRKTVEFQIDVPDDVSDSDILRWLQFELKERGDLSCDHPMSDFEVEAVFGTVQVQ